jgi:hypothetical protein
VKPLYRGDDPRVEGAAAPEQDVPVGHLMRECVLEGVLELGEEAHLVEKFRCLKLRQRTPLLTLVHVGDGAEELERHVLADHGRGLKECLRLAGQPIDARGPNRLDGGWNLHRVYPVRGPIGAPVSSEASRLHEGPHALFDEPDLTVVRLATPAVRELWPVVDE